MRIYLLIAGVLAAIGILTVGCDSGVESADQNSSGTETEEVKIIVTRDATTERLNGAQIVIDDLAEVTCVTGSVVGFPPGECDFILTRAGHSVRITKEGFSTLEETLNVTSTTTVKYYTLYTIAPRRQAGEAGE